MNTFKRGTQSNDIAVFGVFCFPLRCVYHLFHLLSELAQTCFHLVVGSNVGYGNVENVSQLSTHHGVDIIFFF